MKIGKYELTKCLEDIVTFKLLVSMGMIPGMSWADITGVVREITTLTDPVDVRGGGLVYTFSSTSDIDTLSSSDATDDQLIKITGLLDTETVGESVGYAKLNGQNKVLIYATKEEAEAQTGDAIAFWRVHHLENEADEGGDNVGTIYCYVNTTISAGAPSDPSKTRAIINPGSNNSFNCIFTIPKGKVGFLVKGEASMRFAGTLGSGSNYIRFYYRSRRYGKVFKIKKSITVLNNGNSIYKDHRSFPDPIPALTDIKLTAAEVSDDTGAEGAFDILLIDEDKLSQELLDLLGQV